MLVRNRTLNFLLLKFEQGSSTKQSCVQIKKLESKSNFALTVLKSNQHACTRKQTQIKSATGPVKSQIFVKRFVNRPQINVTINYINYLFFIFEGIL